MKNSWIVCFCLALQLLSIPAYATPAQVLIIRHAEKKADNTDLSLKGRERAAALVPYFLGTTEILRFGNPVAIFATSPSSDYPTLRTVETVQALAEKLNLAVDTQFHRKEYAQMVEMIKNNKAYDDKTVLICWEHLLIGGIATEFGVKDAPTEWPDAVFDRIWIIDFAKDNSPLLEDRPQRLLFGDSAE